MIGPFISTVVLQEEPLGVIDTMAKSLKEIVSSVIGEERCSSSEVGHTDFECQE